VAGVTPRQLGRSGITVSNLALGSWRTFERIPRETGVAVMRAAMEAGIDFLDDARYNDETGTAPIPTGYSEVVFGELFRAAGWKRSEVILANKLWWEFWPGQDAAAELDASLGRMKVDHLDLAYAEKPPPGLEMDELVRQVGGLIASGKLRAWGVLNWSPAQLLEAGVSARRQRVPEPCAAQLAYSVAMREHVEDHEMVAALETVRTSVVASFSMLGGVLSGKYLDPGVAGRWTGSLDDPRLVAGRQAAVDLRALGEKTGFSAAALAIAFPLLNPRVASVLFGATSVEQVRADAEALEVIATLNEGATAELLGIGSSF
jgi:L-glyceraldehyde 3-phosphate reductase